MNIKLATYLEQCNNWLDDRGIEFEIAKLNKKVHSICVAMERCTISIEEADKRCKPIMQKINGLHQIQTDRNIQKCSAMDEFIRHVQSKNIVVSMGIKKEGESD